MECLETVTFEPVSRLRVIQSDAFHDDIVLRSIIIPASVETIEAGCFWGCVSLKTVTFARGGKIRSLGYRAFMNCKQLEGLSIPASVEVVGKYCFGRCKSFSKLTFEPGSRLRELRSVPLECLGELDIPDSVEILGCHGKIPENRRLVIEFGRNSKLVTMAFYTKGSSLRRAFVRRSERSCKEARMNLEFGRACASRVSKDQWTIPGLESASPESLRQMFSSPPGEWSDEHVSEVEFRYGGLDSASDSDDW
jgi:hypothetical protein